MIIQMMKPGWFQISFKQSGVDDVLFWLNIHDTTNVERSRKNVGNAAYYCKDNESFVTAVEWKRWWKLIFIFLNHWQYRKNEAQTFDNSSRRFQNYNN